jgi:hypothetical protein
MSVHKRASEREYPSILRAHPTPQATIEAIMHCIRTHGLAALKEPVNLERLSRCDAAAKAEIERRIAKLPKN